MSPPAKRAWRGRLLAFGAAVALSVGLVLVPSVADLVPPGLPVPGPIALQSQTEQASAPANPHGPFGPSTDKCASCHSSHTAGEPVLLTFPNSQASQNQICTRCHGPGGEAPEVSTHANADFAEATQPTFYQLCTDCHGPHSTPNSVAGDSINDHMILASIDSLPVVLDAQSGEDSYDDGFDDGEHDSICVVCHTTTSHNTVTSTELRGEGHSPVGTDCIGCHGHGEDLTARSGFMPTGGDCLACHSSTAGSRRQIVDDQRDGTGTGGDFIRASHHVQPASGTVTADDCVICHDQSQHQQGNVRLIDPDNPATIITYTDGASVETFCVNCHDANGKGGDTTPFSDGKTVPAVPTGWDTAAHNNNGASPLTCMGNGTSGCHSNGHGSNLTPLLAPYDGSPGAGNVNEQEGFCYSCHDSDGPASSDIQSLFAKTSQHSVDGAGGSQLECVNCHNPHNATGAQPLADPDSPSSRWTGSQQAFCLKCHDSAAPVGVVFPGSAPGTGWDKSATVGTTHDTLLSGLCTACHEEHGADQPSLLLGRYDRVYNSTYSAPLYGLCWNCHDEQAVVYQDNAFSGKHDRHIINADAPCIFCHDTHAPYDAGETGLIDFGYGVDNAGDFSLTVGQNTYTLSTSFVDTGQNTGTCALDCHGRRHNNAGYSGVDATTGSTPTPEPTDTPTATPTATTVPTSTDTPTITPTSTAPAAATATPTVTSSPTATTVPTSTDTPTITPTGTATFTPTITATPLPTDTPTALPTATDTPTVTPTGTATFTPTNTATATATPTSSAGDTGLLSPSAEAADTGGDGDGYDLNPTRAFALDGSEARDRNSGTNTNTTCSDAGKDRHRFYNFDVSLPGGATIDGIEVRVDARASDVTGQQFICAELSWDGGSTWTATKTTSTLTDTLAAYVLGSSGDAWGRTWDAASDFTNANFRVRLIDVANDAGEDFYLDWVATRIFYTVVPPTSTPTPSPTSAGFTASAAGMAASLITPQLCVPAAGPTLCVLPIAQTSPSGSTVKVEIGAEEVRNLGSFRLDLAFDDSLLTPVSVRAGPFPGSTGRSVVCLPSIGQDRVELACSTMGDQSGPSGRGILAEITLEGRTGMSGVSTMYLGDVALEDASGIELEGVAAQDGVVAILAGPTPTPAPTPASAPARVATQTAIVTATQTATTTFAPAATSTATEQVARTPNPTPTPPPAMGDALRLGEAEYLAVLGAAAGDSAGHALASGDINGDGRDDLIIGAPHAHDGERTYVGKTYVIFGRTDLPSELDLSRTHADLVVVGPATGARAGYAVAATDLNEDGRDDLIVGAPGCWWCDNEANATYILYGSDTLPRIIDLNTGSADVTISGLPSDRSGSALATGDLNGDGTNDLVIGSPHADKPGVRDAGAVHVVFGGDGLPSAIDLSDSPDFTLRGKASNDQAGRSVALGDLNADGVDDLVVGAPAADPLGVDGAGEVYAVYGGPTLVGPSVRDAGSADVTVTAATVHGLTGYALAVGDISADGRPDLVIGAPGGDTPGGSGEGAVHVLYGGSLPRRVDLGRSAPDLLIVGDDSQDQAGAALSVDDANGDGVGDLIVGAPGAGAAAGETYLVWGRSDLPSVIDLHSAPADLAVVGGETGDRSGSALLVGEIDSADPANLIIGAPGAAPGGRLEAGAVYVLPGRKQPRQTPTPTATPRSTAFVWPADGWISQRMSAWHPNGIDIAVDSGSPVRAVRAGRVTFAGGNTCCGLGYYVVVVHDDGWSSLYAHLSAFAVKHGDRVAQGQHLGSVGATGYASGPHLHFELHLSGTPVDPLSHLPARADLYIAPDEPPWTPTPTPSATPPPPPPPPTNTPTPPPTMTPAPPPTQTPTSSPTAIPPPPPTVSPTPSSTPLRSPAPTDTPLPATAGMASARRSPAWRSG